MNMGKVSHSPENRTGFMLIEVLVALAIFGLSAVYLVDGAFVASRTIRLMKDARELEQDLLWVRSQILTESSYEKFEEGGELTALSMGGIEWEAEVEMTEVLDLYRVKLVLQYEGNEDFNIEPGERVTEMLLLRPTWGKHADFSTERNRLLEDKRDKVRELKEKRQRK